MILNPFAHSLKSLRTPLMGGALLALLCAPAVQAAPHHQTPTLSVQAQSWVEVEPDKATLSARLWENTPAVSSLDESDASALREARERLEERSRELIAAMEEIGLGERAITAGSLNVYQEQVGQTGEGQSEPMMRTHVERPFNVELDDLEQLTDVLDALVEAGVNALDGVQFDLQDREAATDEALVDALEKAQRKAELMARTLDSELGPVRRIEETQAPIFQPRMMAMRAESASSDAAADYRPGTLRIDAGVNVEWSLTEQDAQDRPDTDAAARE
ncbi:MULTISPECIES: SIMPL domain-containing protein [unclassified Halomonas]|uniref:SIMPL domain-containing protein n=1 Tax=unclassified Halomonas TaxID=2609666 RepID=UPI00209D74B2|nr:MULTISPECIES: SIMPL domain-containing protein [unclassified Halomonas]MCP1315305.1 SIMPL domain-containing protein [Halomonas sp. 707D7]MCP1325631.1 SIMPL domain-containing protein [Halomonas sp. 707D4]